MGARFKRLSRAQKGRQGPAQNSIAGLSNWLVAATQKAYEFAPSSYTFDAFNAAQAIAKEIRKQSTQPHS